jgi:uncharacterized coiled-coil protein SlyX
MTQQPISEKTMEDKIINALGSQMFALLGMQHQMEHMQKRIVDLEKHIPAHDANEPVPPEQRTRGNGGIPLGE